MLEGISTLVFATHDVTPEQWADFAKAAGPGTEVTKEETEVYNILIHSPSIDDHLALSHIPSIPTTVHTKLASASFEELKSPFAFIYDTAPRNIQPELFLLLDAQSFQGRSVIIIMKDLEFGDKLPGAKGLASDRREKTTVWKKYCCPWEEAFNVQMALEAFGPPEPAEPFYVGELGREEYVSSESEEQEEESSEEESGDSEFWEDDKP